MPPIGGLEAAANLAKIKGEYYGKIYPQWAEVYKRFNKGKGRSVGTRGYELATEKTPVSTYAFTTDGGAQPAGESVKTMKPIVFATTMTGALRLTKAAMDDLSEKRTDQNYVNSWTRVNVDSIIKQLYSIANIHLCGNGVGRLATISTGANSITQTVDNVDNTRYLRYGVNVDIVHPTTFVVRGTAKIVSDPAPGDLTFELASPIDSTTGDLVVPHGSVNRSE